MTTNLTSEQVSTLLDSILPRVSKPARYIGGENSVRVPLDQITARLALAFPDTYEVGMSNLGLRILYHVLNGFPHVWADRVFAPAADMEERMRADGLALFGLESRLPLRSFDLVGFSLAYELTYTTVLNMLDLSGIPVLSSDRGEDAPIIIAGGHCASNPEPISAFIDAFVIGDGEEAIAEIAGLVSDKSSSRPDKIAAMSRLDGVYVPALHDGIARVRARTVADLDKAPFPQKLIVPHIEAVHDRVALEIMRGCTRGCRFCQAGMITRPVRERSLETLCTQANELLQATGYEEVALTSLSSADYSHIDQLVGELTVRHEAQRVGISLPSLRADAKCVELAAQIQKVRKSGLTFAPEAGSQRLRDVINKNVTENDLIEAVEAAVSAGWRRVKLYFMIGLPTETDDDLRGIADMVSKVVSVGRRRGRPLTLNITISPFVPKPHTPFQWRAMVTPEELDRRIALLRPLLSGKNIQLSWHEPSSSRIEAALARGDKRLCPVIYSVWKSGGNLEQDNFVYDRWKHAFESNGLEISEFANRDLDRTAPLPWDHIDFGVTKEFLLREDERADKAQCTQDCRTGACSDCGVRKSTAANCVIPDECEESRRIPNQVRDDVMADCVIPDECEESRRIPNQVRDDVMADCVIPNECEESRRIPNQVRDDGSVLDDTANRDDVSVRGVVGPAQPACDRARRLMVVFSKGERLRWLGHLDLIRIFDHAVRMSGIPIAYSEGFNPRPKMSVASALPLGATADQELFVFSALEPFDVTDIAKRLRAALPDGIGVTSVDVSPYGAKPPAVCASDYVIGLNLSNGASLDDLTRAVGDLMARSELVVTRESGGKRRNVDIRAGIESMSVISNDSESAAIGVVFPHREYTIKPSEVVEALGALIPGLSVRSIHRSALVLENIKERR